MPKEIYNILIIDDLPENIKLLVKILQDEGYRIRIATSGSFALKTIDAELPDLILLDIKMPDIDGFELNKILKSKESTKNIPVIFLSAMDQTESKIKGLDIGAVDYITKPFKVDEVLARVKRHLKLLDEYKKKEKSKNYIKSGLTQEKADKILSKIMDYMENKKPFLKESFSIEELSKFLNISLHNISEVINCKLDKNFSTFINEYRIEYFMELVKNNEYKKFTIEALANNSGFKSKSSFINAFKKKMNITPHEYLNKLL